MKNDLTCTISIKEEVLEGENVFVVDCIELGVSDFGKTPNEAIQNLKTGISLLLEEAPEKRMLLQEPKKMQLKKISL